MAGTRTLGAGTWRGVRAAIYQGFRMSISSKVTPYTVLQILPTAAHAVGSQRIRWSCKVRRKPARWAWLTGIGIMWKAWKRSFLILVNSSTGFPDGSTISRRIANGSERVAYLQSMSHQGHIFFLETFKPKLQWMIKLMSVPFDLLAAWEWASSICNSTGLSWSEEILSSSELERDCFTSSKGESGFVNCIGEAGRKSKDGDMGGTEI